MLTSGLNIIDSFENEFALFFITDEDIFYCDYKKGITIDLEAAKKIVYDRLIFQKGKSHFSIVDVSKIKLITTEAKKYFETNGYQGLEATALLVFRNRFMRIISTAFMALIKTPKPIKIVETKEEGREWVLKLMNKKQLTN